VPDNAFEVEGGTSPLEADATRLQAALAGSEPGFGCR